MIRFLDADNLKLVTMSGFVIYKPSETKRRNFIIQIGRQGLIKMEDLGIQDFEQSFGQRIKEIFTSQDKYVYLDPELANYVSEQDFVQMKEQLNNPQ